MLVNELFAKPGKIKNVNKAAILSTLLSGHNSRISISRATGLSPATVSNLVSALSKEGLIVEEGLGASRGGRKPRNLRFNAESHYVVAADIPENIMVAADLEGNLRLRECITDSQMEHAEKFPRGLVTRLRTFLADSAKKNSRVMGIGISMSAPGTCIDPLSPAPPNPDPADEIRLILEERTGIATFVESSNRLCALGEQRFGCGRGFPNLVFVNVGHDGVGAGVMVNDRLYRGSSGGAANTGHIQIDTKGPVCRCGNSGCLGILKYPDGLAAVIKKGEEMLMQYLCVEVSVLTACFDPGIIVFGGTRFNDLGDKFFAHLKKKLLSRMSAIGISDRPVEKSSLNELAAARGAAALAWEKTFKYRL